MSDRVLITKSTLTRLGSSLRSKLPGADGTKTISQWASFIDDWNGGGTAAPSYTVSDCGESSCNGTYRLTPMNVASGDHGAVYAKEPTTGTDGIDCFLVASYRDDELSNGVPGVRWSIYCDGIERYYINSEAPILGEWNAVGSSSLPVPVVTCSVDMLTLESGGNDEDGVYVDTGFVLNDHPVYARLERMDTDSWYFYHDGASWSLAKGGTTLGTSSSLEGASIHGVYFSMIFGVPVTVIQERTDDARFATLKNIYGINAHAEDYANLSKAYYDFSAVDNTIRREGEISRLWLSGKLSNYL